MSHTQLLHGQTRSWAAARPRHAWPAGRGTQRLLKPARAAASNTAFESRFPPFGSRVSTLVPVKPRLWVIAQPLGIPSVADIRLNMVVVQLDDESLWVSSPVAPTEQCLELLQQCGTTVSHLVIPNNSQEHYVFAPAMAAAFPDAKVWAPPGLLDEGYLSAGSEMFPGVQELKDTHQTFVLGNDPGPEWPAGIKVALFRDKGPAKLVEAVMYLEAQKAACFADLGFGTFLKDAPADQAEQALQRLWNQVGTLAARLFPGAPKLLFPGQEEYAREYVRQLWAWDADTLLLAHLQPVASEGRLELAKGFAFLQMPELDEYLAAHKRQQLQRQ